MAYEIIYHIDKHKFKRRRSSLRFSAILLLCFNLFLFLVGTFWPEGIEFLRRSIPYQNSLTIVATLNDFAENLRRAEEPLAAFVELYEKMLA